MGLSTRHLSDSRLSSLVTPLPKHVLSTQGWTIRYDEGCISEEGRPAAKVVPEGGHDTGEGRRHVAYVLRLPRRALEAPADVERDRVAVRDCAAASACDQGGRDRGRRAS